MTYTKRFLDLGPGIGVELHDDVLSPEAGWLALGAGDPWPSVVGWLATYDQDLAKLLVRDVELERLSQYAQDTAPCIDYLCEGLALARARSIQGRAAFWEWIDSRVAPLDVWIGVLAPQAAADWICAVSRRCKVRVHASTTALWDWSSATVIPGIGRRRIAVSFGAVIFETNGHTLVEYRGMTLPADGMPWPNAMWAEIQAARATYGVAQ